MADQTGVGDGDKQRMGFCEDEFAPGIAKGLKKVIACPAPYVRGYSGDGGIEDVMQAREIAPLEFCRVSLFRPLPSRPIVLIWPVLRMLRY